MSLSTDIGRGARFRGSAISGLVVLCACVLTIAAVLYVWQRYQFVRLGFEVARLRQEQAALAERIEPLEVERNYLERLERLDALARGPLGLRPPAAGQVLILEGHAASR
jgi:cell division protein FtsL